MAEDSKKNLFKVVPWNNFYSELKWFDAGVGAFAYAIEIHNSRIWKTY